jgi:hypothetical protein
MGTIGPVTHRDARQVLFAVEWSDLGLLVDCDPRIRFQAL